ncbi:hypothetical protein O181_019563 [Austropuccinia psidii MF-1]|uniref:Uncharacterized protein n=1 Tax=Austropuccinia psidii MF-1 TaxID=1389203 RepID=A0A9Q3CB93_9BASI|nr:hypothetical protein [Austropuccinia psidii MF-1]
MSTPLYSSMCICMCQYCSAQMHSSPESDRKGVSLTPFQYKQHIKELKSAIAPKSLPNIPTSASGSECLKILLDQILSADFSQLTQSTFSTPPGLNSTAQKPYSGSQNLPPQELGMILSTILSLSSGGHPTPAFHIPQDLSTIFGHLQLEPVIHNYICFPQCFFLNGLTESFTTDQPHCQRHNDPNDHYPPCTQSLGKFINSFEPCTQNTTNIKKKCIQTKNFIYQPFKNWLVRFLQRAGIMEILRQNQHSQIPKGSFKCEIRDGLVWRRFTGTRNINDSPFMSIPGALGFHICVDWLNAHGKSTQLASIGPIMLICLNLPPSERLKPEIFYVAGIIPGPKEPTALQLDYLLMPLIKELKELWQGYHFSPTSTGPSGSFIYVAILTAIMDVVAMRKLTGFLSHSSNHFCNFCTINKAQIEEIDPQFHYTRSYQNHKSTIAKWLWATPKQQQEIFSEYGVLYAILEDLLYWDATIMFNLDIMHNLILVILKNHSAFKLCIPESKLKIYFRTCRKYNDTNSSDSDSMTSNSSLDQITLREDCSLRRDTAENKKLVTPHYFHLKKLLPNAHPSHATSI